MTTKPTPRAKIICAKGNLPTLKWQVGKTTVKEFSEVVRYLYYNLSLTRGQIAEITGTSLRTASNMICGRPASFDVQLKTAMSLAKIAELEVQE